MVAFSSDIRLAREMSLLDATLIGVGAMIGAGIFVLIGIAAGEAGPALLLSFVLNGAIALFTAMSYAELGSCYHDAGGGYLWVKEGLPKWNGFLSGWMSWFAHAVACSLYALGFGAYFEHVLREFAVPLPDWGFLSPQKILAGAMAILFSYVNYRGASETGRVGNLVTLAKIIILLIFSGFGLELIARAGDPFSVFRDFVPRGAGGVLKAMGLSFIAFQGFEVIAQSSEEIRNPRRNIPRAVFLSLAIVIPIYLVVAFVALAAVRPEGMTPWAYLAAQKEIALVEVARTFFTGGGVMLLVGGLISTMSALNATIYSSSRVAFAMGRDRNFPALFGRVHARRHTPHWSILVSTAIVVTMAISFPLEDVASAADIMFLLLFLQVNIAMIRLRRKRPDLDRGYRVPLFPVLSIVGIVLLLLLAVYMLNYSITAWIVTVSWIATGLLVYRFYAARREIAHARKLITLDRLSRRQYGLLVHLDGEKNDPGIVSIALALGRHHAATIVFLRLVEVPEGKPLTPEEGEKAALDPYLAEALDHAQAQGVAARALVRVSRRATQGILDTALEEDCNLIVRGHARRPGFLWRVYGAMFDAELRSATCEVATLHGELPSGPVRRILALAGADAHSRLAMENTAALGDYFGANVRTLAADPDDRGKILRASRWADLLVMGRAGAGFMESLVVRTPLNEIEEEIECPVLSFREFEEPVSLWKRILRGEAAGGKDSER